MPMLFLLLLSLHCAASLAMAVTAQRVSLSTGLSMQHLEARPASATTTPPVLFVHGTFHGAWCWQSRWMEYFADRGVECHAISLRGTSGSPVEQRSIKISEHVEDIHSFVEEVLQQPPILVGHSFGGATCLKYLEAGLPASGLALLCSVPPSGNGPMTLRFLGRSLRDAFLITKGFAMKTAAKNVDDCRALFFDDLTTDAEIEGLLPMLQADAKVGLDLAYFNRNLPARAAGENGRATWLGSAPPAVVIGATRDAVVDEEGVRETARFLGTDAEFFDLPHDVMLCSGWEQPAQRLVEWVKAL